MSEVLERAAARLIAEPPRPAPDVATLRKRVDHRRSRRRGAFLALTALAVVGGLTSLTLRPGQRAAGNDALDAGFDNDGTVPCNDYGCGEFDSLAVAPGVDDFYVGPASLGDPIISASYWNAAIRCVELDPTASECTQVEGLGIVALVTYGSDPATQIQVGTTFGADLSIADYATALGPMKSAPTDNIATTVRGHAAIRFVDDGQYPAVVWEERPGVLVWVAVPASREADLRALAEGVQLRQGPPAIPGRVVVPNTGTPWTARDNNGSALIAARFQGRECVGWGYINECSDKIADRTFVANVPDGLVVAGSVPADVDAVQVRLDGRQPFTVTPFAYGGFSSRFFQAALPTTVAVSGSIDWLDADGTVIATQALAAP